MRAAGGDLPTTVIRPRRGWEGLGARELVRHHELLYFLIWRDLKVRYKQTLFGTLWALIQPFGLLVVLSLTVGQLPGIAPPSVPYPVFAFVGLLAWGLFAQGLFAVSGSLVNSAGLLGKVYFPRLLLPLAAVGVSIVDYLVALAALAITLVVTQVPYRTELVWLVPLTALVVATVLAFGIWLAAINVRYRDVRHAVPFLVQLWFFASPVAYASGLIPAPWAPIYALNPLVGIIDGYRWAVLGVGEFPAAALLLAVLISFVFLATGLASFRRLERTFADVI